MRHEELLDRALDAFLERGYEQATMEGIAGLVQMTKRTVYALYPDKASLFRATVRRAVERVNVNNERLATLDTSDLTEALTTFAMIRVGQVMTPEGLKLQRVINTESYRFPEIFMLSFEIGARPFTDFLARLFATETEAGRLSVGDPQLAASLFFTMVISGPVRLLVSGVGLSPEESERRVRYGVELFLNGIRPR